MLLTILLTAVLGVQTIPGRNDVISTAAEWVQDRRSGEWRLITGGVDGVLVEWDLRTLLPRASSPSYGGASWALALQPRQPGGEEDAGERRSHASAQSCKYSSQFPL